MKDMEQKIRQSMEQQCFKRGYAAPADVLMDIGTLERKSYDAWRAGRVPFLESVCHANLHKLAEMLKIMRNVAVQRKWNPSVTVYKHKSLTLRFSKYGNPNVEKAYSTHYVAKKPKKEPQAAPNEPAANSNAEPSPS